LLLQIAPTGAASFSHGLQMVCETYHTLKGILKKKYGLSATGVGDEGGFAPQVQSNEEGLVVLQEAIAKAGYEGRMKMGMDVAASELHTKSGGYDLNFKVQPNDGKDVLSGQQLLELYASFARKYPIVSIEDPFEQDDWANWAAITVSVGAAEVCRGLLSRVSWCSAEH
jgi:enolase